MHDLNPQPKPGPRTDTGVLVHFPQAPLEQPISVDAVVETGSLVRASFNSSEPDLDPSASDLPQEVVQQYFSAGNSVGEEGAETIERAREKDKRTVDVDERFVIEGLTKAGYTVNNGVVSRSPEGGTSSEELSWQIPLDILLESSGSEFFKSTAKPLIDRTISESRLPAELQKFTREQLETYLVQLWPTIRTTPRGLILAVTQPEEPNAPRGDALGLLRKQIVGILQDELGVRQEKNANLDTGELTLGSDAIKLNGNNLLLLRPRSADEEIGDGELDTLVVRKLGRPNRHLAAARTPSDDIVNIGGIMDEERDRILFTKHAHLRDYERSLNHILGDPGSTWKEQEIAPEVERHCLRFCQWLSGDIIRMPDGTRASEKMPYWLVAASVESRFPEKVILIMEQLQQVFPETFRGVDALRFWKLHAMDAGEHGHGESLIRTLGAVFPPAGVDADPNTQLTIALERLVAVDATARYFREIVAFDDFIVNYITNQTKLRN